MSLGIGVQLTTRCNLDCEHCFVEGSGNDLSIANLAKIVAFAKKCDCAFLAFSGGEPTLHPEFPKIIELLTGNGLKFTMVSNGWNFVEWYKSIGPNLDSIRRITFSLDGATEEIHDLNRGNGSYRKVLQATSVCNHKSIPFGLRMTVSKRNIHQLEEMALLAAKVGAEELFLIPLQPTPRMIDQDLILFPQDIQRIQGQSSRLRSIFRMKISLTSGYRDDDPLALCPPLSLKQLYITSKGLVGFCCQLADYGKDAGDSDIIGSLDEMTLFEAYQRFIDRAASFTKIKIGRLDRGTLSKLDYYPCWYCAKYFGKVDWMARHTGNPWSDEMSEVRAESFEGDLATAHIQSADQ